MNFLTKGKLIAGSPLWVETQNIQAEANGHYTALLGSASAEGDRRQALGP